jgi:UDP-N-acetylmuramoylalanine--D-glutamate ligase
VVGLGLTGLSCARHLYRQGQAFSVVDTRTQPPGLESLQREMPDIQVYAGVYPADLLQEASELVVSPGIALDDPVLASAREAGVAIVGDIDLFMREARAPVIGITGSNAKSTVTELVGSMAREAGLDAGVGGNLGTPALDLLAPERELYVLELSSFQLERAGNLGLSVATVLNVSVDHLDRHGTLPAYHRAKHRIFHGCRAAVVNRDDPLTVPLVPEDVRVVSWRMAEPELDGFGLRFIEGRETLCHDFEPLLAVDDLGLVGRHNVANALAALAIGHAAGLDRRLMAQALRTFSGLPHRCQLVTEIGGVRFVDDSKGTNVGATNAALAGLGGDRNVVLIAGGQGNGAHRRRRSGTGAESGCRRDRGARRQHGDRSEAGCATGGPWRHRAALTGLRQFRYVYRLRGTRPGFRCCSGELAGG